MEHEGPRRGASVLGELPGESPDLESAVDGCRTIARPIRIDNAIARSGIEESSGRVAENALAEAVQLRSDARRIRSAEARTHPTTTTAAQLDLGVPAKVRVDARGGSTEDALLPRSLILAHLAALPRRTSGTPRILVRRTGAVPVGHALGEQVGLDVICDMNDHRRRCGGSRWRRPDRLASLRRRQESRRQENEHDGVEIHDLDPDHSWASKGTVGSSAASAIAAGSMGRLGSRASGPREKGRRPRFRRTGDPGWRA